MDACHPWKKYERRNEDESAEMYWIVSPNDRIKARENKVLFSNLFRMSQIDVELAAPEDQAIVMEHINPVLLLNTQHKY